MPVYAMHYKSDGVSKTGLTVTAQAHYADDTTLADPTVTELDAVNAPGWYTFTATFTGHVLVTWDAGIDLLAFEREQPRQYGPHVPARDEGIAPAVWNAARADHVVASSFGEGVKVEDLNATAITTTETAASTGVWTEDGYFATNGTAGSVLFGLYLAGLDGDGNYYGYMTTTVAATSKYYPTNTTIYPARSAEFSDRAAIYYDPGAASDRIACRVTGIANDGSGDHFTLLQADGSALTVTSAGVLIVLSHRVVEREVWGALRSAHVTAGTMGEGVTVEDLNAAAKQSAATAVWTEDGYFSAPPGGQSTAGAALLGLQLGSTEGESNFFAYYTTIVATTSKYYPQTASLDVARSAEFVGRRAYYIASPDFERIPCIITGAANDGSGDHYTLTKLDGSALTVASGALLRVMMDYVTADEVWGASYATRAIVAGSMAQGLAMSGAKFNFEMDAAATTYVTINGIEYPSTSTLIFYTDNTQTTEVGRVAVVASYTASGTMKGITSLIP